MGAAGIFVGALAKPVPDRCHKVGMQELTVSNFLTDLNLSILHVLNNFFGSNPYLVKIAGHLDETGLKGLIYMAVFGILWFRASGSQNDTKQILIVMLCSVVISIGIIRLIALLSPFQIRPIYRTDIGYQFPAFNMTTHTFEDWNSFPSDTAGMMFVLTTGFWFVSRIWGIIFGIFSILSMLSRVYLGFHYPIDVFVGAIIGVGVTIALEISPVRTALAAPVLRLERRTPGIFYGLLLAALYEMGTLFITVRNIGKAIIHLIASHHG
jgi:membrane-associated phospholipid phosphatase